MEASSATNEAIEEAAVFLKQRVPESDRVKVYELPGAKMASAIHKGAVMHIDELITPSRRSRFIVLSQPIDGRESQLATGMSTYDNPSRAHQWAE